MAKHRAAHSHWKIKGLALSLSLSLLVITPLLLPGANQPVPAKSSSQTNPAPIPPILPDIRDYNTHPAPFAGELIVRFKAVYGPALYHALAAGNTFNLDFRESLIGAQLQAPQLYEAVPEVAKFLKRYDVTIADAISPQNGSYLLKIGPAFEPRATAEEFSGSGFFEYAEPNFPVYAFRDPNDPLRGQQWSLRSTNAPDAWDITTGLDTLVIAVVDSGVLATHPDLTGKVLTTGRNFAADPANSNSTDNYGHGTYVAGIAAANTNNGVGLAGIAWNARILPIKVLNEQGLGSNATIAKGIRYAIERRADIINISLGGPERSKEVEDATRTAFIGGAVLVASVGNNGSNQPNYPAAFDGVIGVGAFNQRGEAASFSNYGPELSLTAPGSSIIGPWIGPQQYVFDSGTSSAAPFVSGAAALMLSVNRNLSNVQVRNILENTADNSKPGDAGGVATNNSGVRANNLQTVYNQRFGWGRLNILKAVQATQRGDSFPAQRGRIQGFVTGPAGFNPQDVTLILEPGDARVPEISNGFYAFSNLPPGEYSLRLESKKYGISRPTDTFQIRGFDGESYNRDYDLSLEVKEVLDSGDPVGAFKPNPPPDNLVNVQTQRFFAPTGHFIRNKFLRFWLDKGDLPLFGYPISEEFTENGLRVQYFERAVFEYHPEYAGTKDEIQLRLLGSDAAKGRTEIEFAPTLPEALKIENGKPAPPTFYAAETKHNLSGQFLQYWKDKGGVSILGLPISEEFEENGRRVQYFERYRLEIYPDFDDPIWEIVGSQLGRASADARGLLGHAP